MPIDSDHKVPLGKIIIEIRIVRNKILEKVHKTIKNYSNKQLYHIKKESISV